MLPALDDFLTISPFGLSQPDKDVRLLSALKDLTAHHIAACPAYQRIVDLAHPAWAQASTLADLPFLPITLFKHRRLRSIPDSDVKVTIKSSGTTGSQRSQVDLDTATAQLSTRALAATLKHLVGGARLPMLIVDTPLALKGAGGMGARAAAILGLMPFGRDHAFVLRDDLTLDEEALRAFLSKHAGQEILIYGFTFLIWQSLIPACDKGGFDLSKAILMHSGGWKKLIDQAVTNDLFRARLNRTTQLSRIVNFYGMAEMPGTIFPENTDGLLYPPSFADVLIRDPVTFAPLPDGQPGLIQLLNIVPRSFPGHSLLTEDIGVIESVDRGLQGWQGKALRILGRAPKAELRGCSDVLAVQAA